jgi:hypothetical protein
VAGASKKLEGDRKSNESHAGASYNSIEIASNDCAYATQASQEGLLLQARRYHLPN